MKGRLLKMIKDVNGSFDDYSISFVIRQVLLHWDYNWLKMICYNYFCTYKNELLSIE